MKYRQLGNSKLSVSEISLGSWLTYGSGVEQQNAKACIHKAFEVGINFIDTANVYAQRGAESFLGEVLQGTERDRCHYHLRKLPPQLVAPYIQMLKLEFRLKQAKIAQHLNQLIPC